MENVILSCEDCQRDNLADNHNRCANIGKCKKLVLRHLLHILKEPCTEHIVFGPFDDEFHYIPEPTGPRYKHRKDCPDCMKQIEKEIEG